MPDSVAPERRVTARVSIIIPCYNQGHYLGEAIDSVLAQTVPVDEIIVIDDGSTDATETVARQYLTVRYLKQANQGQCRARNRGITESSGDYLIFLDADDRLLPRNVELALEAFTRRPEAGFVCGDYRVIGLEDLRHRHDCAPRPDHYATLLSVRANFITLPGSVMFRRAALADVGHWRLGLRANPDIDLFLRVAYRFPIVCHHQVVAEYRRHHGQISKRLDVMLEAIMTVYRLHMPYIRTRPEYRAAYRAGVELTRSACAEPLMWQMVAHARAGEWRQAWSCFRALARYFPADLMRFVLAKVKRMGRRTRPAAST
ncbi:MAG TPA: glycosyltransferase [Nitrospirales bacterium]|nr:glycosyltransferase [Nitrospirales bacterium]